MRALRSTLVLSFLIATRCLVAAPADSPAAAPHAAPNLFAALLGQSEAALDAKIDAAWRQLFHGDDATERIYFPVSTDAAYIADIGSGDVRTEGLSYGMMLAVQLGRRDEFDRLWTWTKRHLLHPAGPRRGYFAWHARYDGTPLDPGSASDGEEWFAMALLFAAHRWPSDSAASGYAAEAQALLREMIHKRATEEVTPIFEAREHQVVFAPAPRASGFTDPSYHLPAFYELWARWADSPADRQFWAEAARTSRIFFQRAAHARTGLMPEYAHFDGRAFTAPDFGAGKGDFRFDAWRTLANVGLDHAWWRADPWQREQSNRVLRFLSGHLPRVPNQFALDGTPLTTDTSSGLLAMAAVAGHAADPDVARPFVQQLWDEPIPTGQWRYYNGMLYFLALLQTGGRFQVIPPPAR